MSTLKAEQILALLAGTTLTTSNTGCESVERNYPYSFSDGQLPALVINQLSDKPVGEHGPDNTEFQDWMLSVDFLIAVKQTATPLDTALNAIRLGVHKAVMADITLGGLTIMAYPGEVAIESKDTVAGEQPVAVMRMQFEFMYRTHISDPSA